MRKGAAIGCLVMLGFGCSPEPRSVPPREACIDCHDADRRRPTFPDHLAAGFPTTCEDCHTQQEWSPAAFDHDELPLVGGHSKVACLTCHEKQPVPEECIGCHADDRQRATAPNHLDPGFSTTCNDCHNVFAWKPASIDHTSFPLLGKHAGVRCEQCHTVEKPPKDCFSCHEKDRDKSTTFDHRIPGFPTACENCHTPAGWKLTTFKHDQFPLTGRHSTTPCARCHTSATVSPLCYDCHASDRKPGTSPDHFASGFSTACDNCHSTSAWKPAAFDHAKFPLTGHHAGLACASCHPGGDTSLPISPDCFSCHAADRPTGTIPNHFAVGFITDCGQCHTTSAWKPATFDHTSYFPLTSPHNVGCASCHLDPNNAKAYSCLGCHEHSQTTMNEKHKEVAGYSYDSAACMRCHPDGRVHGN